MSLSVKKYLELPEGATIALNKESFVVKSFDEIDGRREPVLVNVADGSRLYGGLYVAHLMRIVSSADGMVDPPEYLLPLMARAIPIMRASSSSPDLDDLTQMSIQELGDPGDLFYCTEIETGRLEHVTALQYMAYLYA
jgi:hypothetical protein